MKGLGFTLALYFCFVPPCKALSALPIFPPSRCPPIPTPGEHNSRL